MLIKFFVDKEDLPNGFEYPTSYVSFTKGSIPDLEPWRFLHPKVMDALPKGLRKRYPNRCLVPFARRVDNDDVACFDASINEDDPTVLIIHDFASPGWEQRGKVRNFIEWLQFAKDESLEGQNQ